MWGGVVRRRADGIFNQLACGSFCRSTAKTFHCAHSVRASLLHDALVRASLTSESYHSPPPGHAWFVGIRVRR